MRYLGLNLAGAKSHKTALAALEYYPPESKSSGKIFLLEVYEEVAGDQALLELIEQVSGETGVRRLGVDAPLTLPPCLECARRACRTTGKCTAPAVKWMREIARRATRRPARPLEVTPYTQRPFELYARFKLLPELPEYARFEIDEALGGTKAPLTARMHWLRRHLGDLDIVEVWPKLSIAALAARLRIPKRTLETYRSLELGAESRETILELISEKENVFIYERDLRKLAVGLGAFDAFICAYTALLSDTHRCSKIGTGFPNSSGWVQFPL